MYGVTVKVNNLEIFVTCNPSTPDEHILEKAVSQIMAWKREPDYGSQAKSIAFRHGVRVVG